ncbi:MAG: NAD(P)H-dependent flavin oxidoreductase [Promethearchaeota archaeon]
MIKTKITEMLNIKYPIIQAGMGPFATENLAFNVSNNGALGIISHSGGPLMGFKKPVPKIMEEAIDYVNDRTKNTFGVNVRVSRAQRDAGRCIRMVCNKVQEDSKLAKKLKVIITSAGDPKPWTEKIHKAGLLHFHVVASSDHAKRFEKYGGDCAIASGYEAGGHLALKPIHTFVLVPAIVKAVNIPVIAAGGMVDGRSLAAALAFGAQGIQLGTRFIATKESDFKDNYKNSFIRGNELSTVVLPGFFSPHCRYLKNIWTEELEKMIEEKATDDELLRYKALGRSLAAEKGDENGSLLCGMCVGQINDIPTVKDLIQSIMREAEDIIANLSKFI